MCSVDLHKVGTREVASSANPCVVPRYRGHLREFLDEGGRLVAQCANYDPRIDPRYTNQPRRFPGSLRV
jgi:hypothetical protein